MPNLARQDTTDPARWTYSDRRCMRGHPSSGKAAGEPAEFCEARRVEAFYFCYALPADKYPQKLFTELGESMTSQNPKPQGSPKSDQMERRVWLCVCRACNLRLAWRLL